MATPIAPRHRLREVDVQALDAARLEALIGPERMSFDEIDRIDPADGRIVLSAKRPPAAPKSKGER